MKLPRDLPGNEAAKLLTRHYGYRVTRTKGSHMTVTLTIDGNRHSVTVPRHRDVHVGTLDGIIAEVPWSDQTRCTRNSFWLTPWSPEIVHD